MPAALTYPGVYVEEIPSGVRTITGVATSIAAFVGRTAMGPTDRPVTTTSWDDYVRRFGDLDLNYPVGFAVRDFYLNGGAQAIIVRVFKDAATQVAALDALGLALEAASPGAWSNTLRARVTKTDPAKLTDVATLLGVAPADLFNLAIQDTRTGVTERFINLTAAKPSARHVTGVLLNESNFVRTKAGTPAADPTAVHKDKKSDGTPIENVWADDTASSKVTAVVKDSAALAAAADFGKKGDGSGLYLLRYADLFNLLCIPPDSLTEEVPTALHADATAYCVERRALYIVDPPKAWTTVDAVKPDDLLISGPNARNAALYFPRVIQANPLHGDQPETFVPCGAIAGVMARTDVTRGVWKAPAGVDASLTGVKGLSVLLTDLQNGLLNPIGVNCLRTFPIIGNIIWGARTLRGADVLGDEYKYVPVRRLALFMEESLFRGLKWVVFEPNDEPLWGQIRLNVGSFMQDLFRQGAFQGSSARDAYFVKCDKDTTTQSDINHGIVNVIVGFAPLKPAEFVVLKIQQIAGQIQT
jgi:Bacteriophage tail sheath protein